MTSQRVTLPPLSATSKFLAVVACKHPRRGRELRVSGDDWVTLRDSSDTYSRIARGFGKFVLVRRFEGPYGPPAREETLVHRHGQLDLTALHPGERDGHLRDRLVPLQRPVVQQMDEAAVVQLDQRPRMELPEPPGERVQPARRQQEDLSRPVAEGLAH